MIERDYYEASLCTETKPKNAPKANPRTKNEHKTRITYKKKKIIKKNFLLTFSRRTIIDLIFYFGI